ncbi:MAG: SDR family NAD(P)-dependent oxidoreductase [Granulosicoccus sp.]
MSVALVTGVLGGIGEAIATRLSQEGHTVVVSDHPGRAFDELAEHSPHPAFPADLGSVDQVQQLVSIIGDRFEPPGIVVNAAGGVCGQASIPVEQVQPAQWKAIFAANVDSAFHLAQACLPAMQAMRSGRFVTISSGAGLKPSLTGIQAYTAAKHALIGLTRQLAMSHSQFGITVNSVAPGFILSNEATRQQWASYGEQGQAALIDRIYTRRLGQPEDIANAVAFLASDQAAWITGQVLQVDGGTS